MNNCYSSFIKPIFDLVISVSLLVIVSPVVFIIAIVLFPSTNGRPFFTQQRPGKAQRIFKLIKFRTMRDAYDVQGVPLPDKERITRVGKFIRSTSLDELPQLINVLKGDMSLVGPRPLLVKYLPLYNNEQARRHDVKPGITGWTQINGRNSISWEKKFELDVWYVDHISFLLDIRILFITVVKVIKSKDIDSSVVNTMPPFTGNKL